MPRTDDIDMGHSEIGETDSLPAPKSNKDTARGGSRLPNEIDRPGRVTDEQMKEALRRMKPVCSPCFDRRGETERCAI